jgi:hypothetical protein
MDATIRSGDRPVNQRRCARAKGQIETTKFYSNALFKETA